MPWTKTDERAFLEVLFALGEVYETPVSTIRGEMFMRLVEDLPFEAVKAAAAEHGRRSPFFPKPGDLRVLVEGNLDDRAELGWLAMIREVRRVGYTGKPTWTDPIAQRAAEGLFGSWRRLCESLPADGPELLGYRKQFVALYAATARQAQQGVLPPSRDEARERLDGLKRELQARGLPTGKK